MKDKKISPKAASQPPQQASAPGIISTFFSVLLCLLLAAALEVMIALLFLHALSQSIPLPDAGFLSASWITLFFDKWIFLILGITLVMVPLLSILILNLHRIRRFYFFFGFSALCSAVLSIFCGILYPRLIAVLSGAWQDLLVNTTAVFLDFSVMCAMILTAVGAACISICGCISAWKGGSHEKVH